MTRLLLHAVARGLVCRSLLILQIGDFIMLSLSHILVIGCLDRKRSWKWKLTMLLLALNPHVKSGVVPGFDLPSS